MLAEDLQLTVRDVSRRAIAPMVGWIPDVNAIPTRRLVAIGAIGSVFFHLIVLIVWVLLSMKFAFLQDRSTAAAAAPASSKPLVVQLVPMPEKEIAPRPPKRSELLNARGLTAPEEKPDSNEYESDKDMRAASESAPTGLENLPSQEGRTDIPAQDFQTQDVRIGLAKPEQIDALRTPPDPKATQPASPLYKPQPLANDQLASAERAKPADQLPEPAKAVKATPPPLKLSDKTGENVLEIAREKPALADPVPKAVPTATPMKLAMATTPSPARPPSVNQRYQESLQKTRIEGNISNRGRAGVNSINTPMGRYHRRMCQQIESIWTLKTREHPELLGTSTVRMRYLVQADGTVTDIQVLDAGGDPRHAQICTETLRTLKLEPLPPEATPLLSNGVLEMALSFTLF